MTTKVDAALSGKNTVQAAESTRTRYRGLIASIALFLLLITILMMFSIYASSQIAKGTAQLAAAEQLNSSYQATSQSLYSLRLSSAEDPKGPQPNFAISELKKGQVGTQQALDALQNGGVLNLQGGQAVTIDQVTDQGAVDILNGFAQVWKPIHERVGVYLQDAQSVTANPYILEEVAVQMRNNQVLLREQVNALVAGLTKEANERTAVLQMIQVGGIVAAIIYFIIFVVYFLRKLRAADVVVAEARHETGEILNTVSSGLFLLDRNLNIGSQYSRELEHLLGTRTIAGQNILTMLRGKLPEEEVENTGGFIGQLYNTRVKERLIGSLNPLVRIPMQVTDLKTGEKKTRYLDFKFNRVYRGQDIAKVLVSVTDETDAVLLEQKIALEREQGDIQLEMLGTLLNSDQKMVSDFVKSTKRRNLEINNILKSPGESQAELRAKASTIFREVHSLKGEASTFNLHGFTVLAENLENEIKDLQNITTLSGQDFLGLAVSLDKLMQLTQTIENLSRRLSGGNNVSAGVQENSLHIQDRFDLGAARQAYYARFVAELAMRNRKKVVLTAGGLEVELDGEAEALVKEICVQMLRNAVVHGIEAPQTRAAKQKNPVGQIQLNISEAVDHYTVSLRDDGAGIRIERVKAKAVELGIYTEQQAAELTTQQIYALLFRSGFSTAEALTGDAGRGVGLDVIKERVSRLGGKIGISSTPDAYTRFVFSFPKINKETRNDFYTHHIDC